MAVLRRTWKQQLWQHVYILCDSDWQRDEHVFWHISGKSGEQKMQLRCTSECLNNVLTELGGTHSPDCFPILVLRIFEGEIEAAWFFKWCDRGQLGQMTQGSGLSWPDSSPLLSDDEVYLYRQRKSQRKSQSKNAQEVQEKRGGVAATGSGRATPTEPEPGSSVARAQWI